MRSAFRAVLFAFVLTAVCLNAHVTEALHRNTPRVVEVTARPALAVGSPQFAGKSNVLLFHSDADLLGNGNDVPQIFVFDLARRVKKHQLSLFQVTFGDQGSFAPTGAKRGKILAFHTTADLLGNGSSGRQIVASLGANWDVGVVPLFQVTQGLGESYDADMSGAGRALAFTSTGDLTDEGVAPGPHLYRADLTALTRSSCAAYPCPDQGNPGLSLLALDEAWSPALDWKGGRVAFVSRGDVAGTGCANGASQIFLRDFHAGTVEQLTCGTADSRNPRFTRDDQSVIFDSDADLTASCSTRSQIFQINVTVLPRGAKQLTFGTDGDSTNPAPNGTRTDNRFFFLSTADLTKAGGAGVQRLFEFDSTRGFTQITDGQPVTAPLAAVFQFGAFASDADFLGDGNVDPKMMLVNAYAAANAAVPTPSPKGTPVLDHITLTPRTATHSVGEVQRFTATGYRSNNTTVNLTQQMTYASSDPAVASAPNTDGDRSAVTGLAPGTVTISATDPVSGMTTTASGGDATLTVVGPLESITLTPTNAIRNVGQAQSYTATGHYGGGSTRNITQQINYASSDPNVAVATNLQGNKSRVEAVGSGTATISATDPATGITSTDSGGDATLQVP